MLEFQKVVFRQKCIDWLKNLCYNPYVGLSRTELNKNLNQIPGGAVFLAQAHANAFFDKEYASVGKNEKAL